MTSPATAPPSQLTRSLQECLGATWADDERNVWVDSADAARRVSDALLTAGYEGLIATDIDKNVCKFVFFDARRRDSSHEPSDSITLYVRNLNHTPLRFEIAFCSPDGLWQVYRTADGVISYSTKPEADMALYICTRDKPGQQVVIRPTIHPT